MVIWTVEKNYISDPSVQGSLEMKTTIIFLKEWSVNITEKTHPYWNTPTNYELVIRQKHPSKEK